METGFSGADSRDDFARARRDATLAKLARRLRLRSGDIDVLLPFDEVVAALGNRGQTRLGLRMVDLDAIVGSTDRLTGFDRRFRPTSDLARSRFERLAKAVRQGESLPPVDLLQVGDVFFVQDGHHRVAVMRALGMDAVHARVTRIHTAVEVGPGLRMSDLPLKGHERLFQERVPLPPRIRSRVVLEDPQDYALLAEGVEAWGMRWMQEQQRYADRAEVALAWFGEEYEPVLTLLREAGLHPSPGERPGSGGTDAAVYLRLARDRYQLLRTHRWDDEVIERLRLQARR